MSSHTGNSPYVFIHFNCGGCNKVRKTRIGTEKITICGSCGHKQTITRNDRLIGHNNYNSKELKHEREKTINC